MLSRFTISQRLPSLFLIRVLPFLVVLSLFLGVPPMSLGQPLAPLTNPRTALEEYVRARDDHYSFKVTDVESDPPLTRYTILMQSQKWDPGGEVVNRKIWEHGIAFLVPSSIATDTGLLLIAGGSNDGELIGDDEVERAALVAKLTHSVAAVLFEEPNQPLRFSDEDFDHKEDKLVAYSWDKAVTLRQLKQTASKGTDMKDSISIAPESLLATATASGHTVDYKQPLRNPGCVPASLASYPARDALSALKQFKHSFLSALPKSISPCQATRSLERTGLFPTLQVLPHRVFGANPIPGFLKSLLALSTLILYKPPAQCR